MLNQYVCVEMNEYLCIMEKKHVFLYNMRVMKLHLTATHGQ